MVKDNALLHQYKLTTELTTLIHHLQSIAG